jgi:hypothetical protein
VSCANSRLGADAPSAAPPLRNGRPSKAYGGCWAAEGVVDEIAKLRYSTTPCSRISLQKIVTGLGGSRRPLPNGSIQHGGRHTFGKIDCGHHLFRFWSDRESRIAACWLRSRMYGSDRCVLTRRDCFEQVGGIDESDDQRCRFCWQLADSGYSSMMAAPAIDLQ